MPKKHKANKTKTQTLDEDKTFVENLKEKFLQQADPSLMMPEEDRISIQWKKITYKVPVNKKCCKDADEKILLKNVSGYLPSGSLLV